MKLRLNFIKYAILFVFIYSKFFYFSIYQVSDFNFTLSDLCLCLMLIGVLFEIRQIDCGKNEISVSMKIIIVSFLIGIIISVGSALQETSIISGLVIYLKRWLMLLIIPIYIYLKFKAEDIKKIIYFLIIATFVFAISNYKVLLSSIDKTRLFDSFNPNVLGMVMSIILVLLISYNKDNISKIFVTISIIICSVFIMAVSSRGALFSLIPILVLNYFFSIKKPTYKYIFEIIFLILIIIFTYNQIILYIQHVFPYSYNRIYNTIYYGIFNDASTSARLNTQVAVVSIILSESKLLFFGTGFGNYNMFLAFSKKGYLINTADNMFVNIFAWCGIIGTILFGYIVTIIAKHVIRSKNNPFRKTMILLTLYIFIAGLAQDTLIEPTIGSFYMITLGMFEIYNKDKERIENEDIVRSK